MVMSRVTPENTVGATKKPRSSPSGASAPPVRSVAPSPTPLSMYVADPVALGGRDQGPEPGRPVEGVARRERLGRGARPAPRPRPGVSRGTSIRVRALQVWPGVEEALAHPVGDGGGQVGVGQDDVGRLAAELEGHPLDRAGGHLGHPLAGPGRAGEGHHVDVPVGGDGLADDRTEPGHQVEHAGRHADLVHDVGQHEGVERGHLAGLDARRCSRRPAPAPPWRRSGAAGSSTA